MPKGKKLTEYEKGRISALHELGWSNRRIGLDLGRSHDVINRYLSDPNNYGTAKSPGRPSVLSSRDKRRIVNAASNSTLSSAEIKRNLNLPCTSRTVRNVLKRSEFIVRAKLVSCPKLTPIHKAKRLKFAEKMIQENTNWNKVRFCMLCNCWLKRFGLKIDFIMTLCLFNLRLFGLMKKNLIWMGLMDLMDIGMISVKNLNICRLEILVEAQLWYGELLTSLARYH